MKIISFLGLLLVAGAAVAQQPEAGPQAQVYRDEAGQLRVRKVPRRTARAEAKNHVDPGSYRAEPYALRVQVPGPHPDSAAVVGPGRRRDAMPQAVVPPVRLRP